MVPIRNWSLMLRSHVDDTDLLLLDELARMFYIDNL